MGGIGANGKRELVGMEVWYESLLKALSTISHSSRGTDNNLVTATVKLLLVRLSQSKCMDPYQCIPGYVCLHCIWV
jgi:hypothetical protein